eukprot:m.94863 g.94863  ORF g.94863 m.94863 type:complete len:105 (+) comp15006_c0_seq1:1843-2157(+)
MIRLSSTWQFFWSIEPTNVNVHLTSCIGVDALDFSYKVILSLINSWPLNSYAVAKLELLLRQDERRVVGIWRMHGKCNRRRDLAIHEQQSYDQQPSSLEVCSLV